MSRTPATHILHQFEKKWKMLALLSPSVFASPFQYPFLAIWQHYSSCAIPSPVDPCSTCRSSNSWISTSLSSRQLLHSQGGVGWDLGVTLINRCLHPLRWCRCRTVAFVFLFLIGCPPEAEEEGFINIYDVAIVVLLDLLPDDPPFLVILELSEAMRDVELLVLVVLPKYGNRIYQLQNDAHQ